MTREEMLRFAKPILFNTDMVRAILDGMKTTTRRPIKCKYSNTHLEMFTNKYGTRLIEIEDDVEGETFGKNPDGTTWRRIRGFIETEYERKPYKKGQFLYVRETWANLNTLACPCYYYRASEGLPDWALGGWKPSIHMPNEAARIFLRVTDVRVERLHGMSHDDALKEGIHYLECPDGFTWKSESDMHCCYISPIGAMAALWDSTIPKKDLDKYGWNANPWVWVIEFEKICPDE